jgi:hypothetical protein
MEIMAIICLGGKGMRYSVQLMQGAGTIIVVS